MTSFRQTLAGRVLRRLDEPATVWDRTLVVGLVAAIYGSVLVFVLIERFPGWADRHAVALAVAQWLIVGAFTLELLIRLAGYRRPWAYLASTAGIVDMLAVLPAYVALLVPGGAWVAWLRTARVFKLAKLIKWTRRQQLVAGVAERILPAAGLAIAAKALVVVAEGYAWWPGLAGLDMLVGAAGFAVAVLLGTKLSIAQSRLYDVEDAVCRIVGALRDIRPDVAPTARRQLLTRLHAALSAPTPARVADTRATIALLEAELEAGGIGGPATAGLHRDLEFVLHRALTRTPRSYEAFLFHVAVAYVAATVLLVPGVAGLVATLLIVYVLGGMYVVVDAMDRAFDPDEELITPDLRPLAAAKADPG